MPNTLVLGKKAFTWTVVVATILWAMSAAFIAIPMASAQTYAHGDLIIGTATSTSGPGRPVYILLNDGGTLKRYLFPSQNTYKSWFALNFSAVKNLTEAQLQSYAFGGNVTVKAGTLVKFLGPDTGLYVVEKGGVRRAISAADAMTVYGADYETADLHTIPEAFQANYTAGAGATSAFSPTAAVAAAADIGTDKGLSAAPAASATPAAAVLSVALASGNPGGSVLPTGSNSVEVLRFDISGSGNMESIVLGVGGVGATTDFDNIFLYKGSSRLTTGRTISAQAREVTFSNLAIASPASLSVRVDVGGSATSGDTHAFSVKSVNGASVSGVAGAAFSIGSQGVANLDVQNGSTPGNPRVGTDNVAISSFRVTAGTNDVKLTRAEVTVGGTVTLSDISNFTLWRGGTKVSDGVMNKDRVLFDMSGSPDLIGQGVQRNYDIKANVTGRGSRTIITYFDVLSDIQAIDQVYNIGARVRTGDGDTTCETTEFCSSTNGMTVTTQGGRATVAFNGPAAGDVQRGSQDAQLFKFSLTADNQALDVRNIRLTIAGTSGGFVRGSAATRYFTDIKIKDLDSGVVVAGPREHSSANSATTTGTLTFSDTWSISAGQTRKLAVTADLANSEDAAADEFFAEPYRVTLTALTSGDELREISTSQFLATADIVGGSQNIAGNLMTVQAAALTVTVASTPISGTTVKGSNNVQAVGFAMAAGSASSVKVTQVIVRGQGASAATGATADLMTTPTAANLNSIVLSARLYDGDTAVSDLENPVTGVFTFDNMAWTIPAGQTKKLTVKVNLATTLLDSNTDYFFMYIGNGDITSEDKDANTISSVPTADVNATADAPVAANVFSTVANSGSITAAVDGDTPLSNVVTGGTSNVSMLKVRMIPANEGFWLKDLRIINDAAGDDTGISQIKVKYPKKDGTTGTVTSVLSSAVANFNDIDAYLKRDAVNVIEVLADFTTISESGISGDTPQLSLDFDSNFEAVGEGSGETLTSVGSANFNGNAMTVRKSKPTVTLHAASPSGAASQQTDVEILRFTVTADSVGDVELGRVSFRTNFTANAAASTWNEPVTTDNAIVICDTSAACTDTASRFDASNIRIYDAANSATQLTGTWRLYDSSSTGLASGEDVGYARFSFASAQTVSAGASKTFIVRVDVNGLAPGSDDSVGLTIVDDSSATFAAGSATARGSSFVWGEVGSGATALTIASSEPTAGITGNLVKNLPITGGTLVY